MTVRISQVGVSPPRLELPQPIAATLVDQDATIVEVSLVGCAVHHPARVKVGASVTLQFVWRGKRERVDAKVARSTMEFNSGKAVYVTGLQFADTVDQAPDVIRRIVASLVEESPKPAPQAAPPPPPPPAPAPAAPKPAPKAVAPPPPPSYEHHENVPFLRFKDDFDELEPEAVAVVEEEPEPIFLRCRLVDGKWQTERVGDPAQPDEGFTILAETDDVGGLCRTYEVADPETRKMMRFSFEIANQQQRA